MPRTARMISPRGVRVGLMKRTAFRLIAGSVLLLAIALGFAQGAGAQDTSTSLTVHHRLCGDNYHGGDPFTECHDVLVGTYSLFGGIPGEFSTQNIYCSDSNTGEALDISNGVPVAEGAAVVCDVYEFPEDLSGNTPTPAPAQPTSTPKPNSTVTTLPSTGTGVDSSSNEVLWLIIPAALAIGGLGLVSKRRLS